MEKVLGQNSLDLARKTLINYLSFQDLLTLRMIYRNFDTSFRITDAKGYLHIFPSLTPENIKEYRRILSDLNELLITASKQGRSKRVRKLIARYQLSGLGLDINARDSDGDTALIKASRRGRTRVLRILLTCSDIDVNIKNLQGYTALIEASIMGHIGVVRLLLACSGIDVNARNFDGSTALIRAAAVGNFRVVQILLTSSDIDVNAQNLSGHTALRRATRWRHLKIIEILKQDPRVKN